MKILIATGIFPPEIGGPATYSKILAEEFMRIGHQVFIIAYGEAESLKLKVQSEKLQSKIQNYKVIWVSRKWPKGLRHFVYFLKVFWFGRKSNIIYAQDPLSAGLPALLAAKILGKKFVLKIVGDYAWEQGAARFGIKESLDEFLGKKHSGFVKILQILEKLVAKKADRIIVPSNYLKEVVKKWGIEESKVEVIYNAVEIPKIGISKEEAREKLGLNQEDKILVSAGRLVPWKGFEMLIDILTELSQVKLIIIGDGPEKKNLKSKILNLKINNKINNNILLIKSLPKDELFIYLKAADIFLLNTDYEGFSHQLLEALAVGIPIITTPVGGNKELINEVPGIVALEYNNKEDWLEKISGFMKSPENFPKPEISQSFFQKFSKEEMVKKIELLLKSL